MNPVPASHGVHRPTCSNPTNVSTHGAVPAELAGVSTHTSLQLFWTHARKDYAVDSDEDLPFACFICREVRAVAFVRTLGAWHAHGHTRERSTESKRRGQQRFPAQAARHELGLRILKHKGLHESSCDEVPALFLRVLCAQEVASLQNP